MVRKVKITDRQALSGWEAYRLNLERQTSTDPLEDEYSRKKRVAALEADPEKWFAYYFPNYYTSEPAPFQKAATKRLLKNGRWYEVRAWSRELAKTARAMMEFLYLAMTGKIKNMLLVSNTFDNAVDLLTPFRINLESNNRLINDYGEQQTPGAWEAHRFVIRLGCSFRAIGAGQSPRGTRNEEARPDSILIDDIDTDEETRNKKRIDIKWKWIEKALIPTVSVSGKVRILFNGNIIAKYCCITKAMEKADHVDIVNIRDKNGKSTWPTKNSEADIDYILSKISFASAQQEYFNNPVSEGTVFKEITWGGVPKLSDFRFLVAYGDPAPSNKENKPGSSFKALPLLGEKDGIFYVITCFLEQVQNSRFVTWYWDMNAYVKERPQVYYYIENNSLQDPFYEQVFVPLFTAESLRQGFMVNVIPDGRKKPEKFVRIEGNLEPLNRTGRLIFNQAEKNNPHMQRLKDQFEAVEPGLSVPSDGPDAVEGGVWIIQTKNITLSGSSVKVGAKHFNKKRF